MNETIETHEFVRAIDVAELEPGQRDHMVFEATAEECAAIAARLKLLSMSSFSADIYVLRELSGDVSIFGDIAADVEQACVVTLEPVRDSVEDSIMQRFTDREDDEEAEDEDPVEPIVDDEIEVGEVLVQNLSLALNPYSRAPGVAFEAVDDEAGEPSEPFAALAQLRDMGDKPKK
jgi:uncharacterized metal-binding protein YceD (DUF177 family)